MSNLNNNTSALQSLLSAVNNLPEAGGSGEQATPVISVNSSTGLVTATAGTKSSTYQLAFQAAKTITPNTTSQIAVSSGYYTGGNITVAAIPSTYIQPSGTKTITTNGTYDVKNYASATVNVAGSSSGDLVDYSEAEDAMVTGTISTYTNDRVATIGGYAFYSHSSLVSVSFTNCRSLGSYAFANCKSLTTTNFPVCATVGRGAFRICYSLTSVSFPVCESIDDAAFWNCSSLTTVSFPVCEFIGYEAFACTGLTSVDFPVCINIDSYAFSSCSKLVTGSFPVCTNIDIGAFKSCSRLTSISSPVCMNIGNMAFASCYSLTNISFPACTSIGWATFSSCSRLTSVSFPVCTVIGDDAFYGCSRLTSVSFPVCTTISDYAFHGCSSLTSATFGDGIPSTSTGIKAYIYSYAFNRCSKLTNLTLYYPSVATLSNINAFASTPMSVSTLTGSFGSIYVPASLVDAYKSATNWATYADRITAILIEFTINGIAYYAEPNMTWGEWINSEYNIRSFMLNTIMNVSSGDVIIEGHDYLNTDEPQ